MCKNVLCESPKDIICSDNRCWITDSCRYISSCISKLVSDSLKQYSCICNYTENNLQVYQLPECVLPTNSPTTSPSTYPTSLPTNSSVFGGLNIENEAKEEFNKVYYYVIGAVLFLIVCIMIRFRQCVRRYMCCKNRVNNEDV